ncbi:MAG: STAS-like domain-containing protein [Ferruginibacter sp.]
METKENKIVLSDVLKTPFAVSTEEGDEVFKLIDSFFQKQENVILDFDKIHLIVSTFFNASIGQLYGIYPTEFIQKHLSLINIAADDLAILKKVTDRAKEYFIDKEGVENFLKTHFPNAE